MTVLLANTAGVYINKAVKAVSNAVKQAYPSAKKVVSTKKKASKAMVVYKQMKKDNYNAHNMMRRMQSNVLETQTKLKSKVKQYSSTKGVKGIIKQVRSDVSSMQSHTKAYGKNIMKAKPGARADMINKTMGWVKDCLYGSTKNSSLLRKVFNKAGRVLAPLGKRLGSKIPGLGIAVSAGFIAEDAANGNTRKAAMGTASLAAAQFGPEGAAVSLVIDDTSLKMDVIERTLEDAKNGKVDIIDMATNALVPGVGGGTTAESLHTVAEAIGADTKIIVDGGKVIESAQKEVALASEKVRKRVSAKEGAITASKVGAAVINSQLIAAHKRQRG